MSLASDKNSKQAQEYSKALLEYGVTFKQTNVCFQTLLDEAGKVLPQIKKQIAALDANRDIADALVQELEALYNSQKEDEQSWQTIAPLYALHEELFARHMDLWKSMIQATKNGREFTDVELSCHEARLKSAVAALKEAETSVLEPLRLRAQAAHDKKLKDTYQLQFDEDLLTDCDRLVGNILNTRPTLIVGDKGVAKTQIAKFVMSLYDTDPLVVSVKGDMMSDELIGKVKHDKASGTFVFSEGVLLTAMRKGVPLLLDEINFGDQAIIARLQDILLKKPGEKVLVQEDGEQFIVVQPGFAVFATANEASLRYRHREVLDPAIRDRFDILIRSYPDLDSDPLVESSPALMRLAMSSAVNEFGSLSKYIDEDFLSSFVHLAHVTQYLYAVPAKDVTVEFSDKYMKSVVKEDSQPLMTDCITPRTLSNVVADSAKGNLPGQHFDMRLLKRLVRSLDQSGSHSNAELTMQIMLLLGFETKV